MSEETSIESIKNLTLTTKEQWEELYSLLHNEENPVKFDETTESKIDFFNKQIKNLLNCIDFVSVEIKTNKENLSIVISNILEKEINNIASYSMVFSSFIKNNNGNDKRINNNQGKFIFRVKTTTTDITRYFNEIQQSLEMASLAILSLLKPFDREEHEKNINKISESIKIQKNEINNELSELNKKIKEITTQAEEMLTGATTVELAVNLEATKSMYEKRLELFRTGFFISLGILLIFALPIILPLINIECINDLFHRPQQENDNILLYSLGKIALIIGPIWLTTFFAKNYAELFHLWREYSHKVTLAKSVEGFKKQAEGYEADVTALVYTEIVSSPSTKKSPSAADPKNPLISKYMEKIFQSRNPTH